MLFKHNGVISWLCYQWPKSPLRHQEMAFWNLLPSDVDATRINQRVVLNACNASIVSIGVTFGGISDQRVGQGHYQPPCVGDDN